MTPQLSTLIKGSVDASGALHAIVSRPAIVPASALAANYTNFNRTIPLVIAISNQGPLGASACDDSILAVHDNNFASYTASF
jgi:hypothetical protein